MSNDEYSRIISKKHFDRLISLLENGRIYYGGGYDSKRLIIEPSVLTGINFESPVMKQEIFGPLLPVLSYKTENDLIDLLKKEPDLWHYTYLLRIDILKKNFHLTYYLQY